MTYLFPPADIKALRVVGRDALYPVRRIFCVGQNYAAHAAEMGSSVARDAPWYFTKSAQALTPSGQTLPIAPGTDDYQFECELVVALGAALFQASEVEAAQAVFGYACGLDMTRRDLQRGFKENRRPWDLAKDVENAAIVSALSEQLAPDARLHLTQNGAVKQDTLLTDMVWSVTEILSHLSQFYHLDQGDIVMTGTPAGVGPVTSGDAIVGAVDGLTPVTVTFTDPA